MEEVIGGGEYTPPRKKGDCEKCGSETLFKHRWNILGMFTIEFGKRIGCKQPKCENYYNSVVNKRDRLLDNLGI